MVQLDFMVKDLQISALFSETKVQVIGKLEKEIAELRYLAVINARKNKIDTEIRHVTKPGANLFLKLGFSA